MTDTPLIVRPALPDLPDKIREQLAELLSHRRARNTLRTYETAWRGWETWTAARGLPHFPARPQDLIHYLVERQAAGVRKTTLSITLTVLRFLHSGRIDDPTRSPAVTETWKAIQRKDRRPRKQANTIPLPVLVMMIEALAADWKATTARDRALLTVGWAGALRASEIVALRWRNILLTERGAEITIEASKTDQEGESYTLALPWFRRAFQVACPARALGSMDAADRDPDTFVFRRREPAAKRYRNPITTREVSRIVAAAARAAGLPGSYSAHSLRRGFATWAASQGASDRAIMRQGRWRSRAVMDGYIQSGTLWTDNVLIDLLGEKRDEKPDGSGNDS